MIEEATYKATKSRFRLQWALVTYAMLNGKELLVRPGTSLHPRN